MKRIIPSLLALIGLAAGAQAAADDAHCDRKMLQIYREHDPNTPMNPNTPAARFVAVNPQNPSAQRIKRQEPRGKMSKWDALCDETVWRLVSQAAWQQKKTLKDQAHLLQKIDADVAAMESLQKDAVADAKKILRVGAELGAVVPVSQENGQKAAYRPAPKASFLKPKPALSVQRWNENIRKLFADPANPRAKPILVGDLVKNYGRTVAEMHKAAARIAAAAGRQGPAPAAMEPASLEDTDKLTSAALASLRDIQPGLCESLESHYKEVHDLIVAVNAQAQTGAGGGKKLAAAPAGGLLKLKSGAFSHPLMESFKGKTASELNKAYTGSVERGALGEKEYDAALKAGAVAIKDGSWKVDPKTGKYERTVVDGKEYVTFVPRSSKDGIQLDKIMVPADKGGREANAQVAAEKMAAQIRLSAAKVRDDLLAGNPGAASVTAVGVALKERSAPPAASAGFLGLFPKGLKGDEASISRWAAAQSAKTSAARLREEKAHGGELEAAANTYKREDALAKAAYGKAEAKAEREFKDMKAKASKLPSGVRGQALQLAAEEKARAMAKAEAERTKPATAYADALTAAKKRHDDQSLAQEAAAKSDKKAAADARAAASGKYKDAVVAGVEDLRQHPERLVKYVPKDIRRFDKDGVLADAQVQEFLEKGKDPREMDALVTKCQDSIKDTRSKSVNECVGAELGAYIAGKSKPAEPSGERALLVASLIPEKRSQPFPLPAPAKAAAEKAKDAPNYAEEFLALEAKGRTKRNPKGGAPATVFAEKPLEELNMAPAAAITAEVRQTVRSLGADDASAAADKKVAADSARSLEALGDAEEGAAVSLGTPEGSIRRDGNGKLSVGSLGKREEKPLRLTNWRFNPAGLTGAEIKEIKAEFPQAVSDASAPR